MPVATPLPPRTRPAVARLVGARRDDVVQVLASPSAAFEVLTRQLPHGAALVLQTAGPGLAARGLAAGRRPAAPRSCPSPRGRGSPRGGGPPAAARCAR